MSARDIMTNGLLHLPIRGRKLEFAVDQQIAALEAAGYRVLAPGEVDKETRDRCITAIACGCTGECPSPGNCARDDVAELRHLGEKE